MKSTSISLDHQPARSKTTGFFEARDNLSAELLSGTMRLSGPELAVFRVLLENVFFTADNRRGWVRHDRCGIDAIAPLTGYSPITVRRVLAALEDGKLISRRVRPMATGGRHPDEICIVWHGISDLEPEGITESASDDTESASDPAEGITESASYIPRKRVQESTTEEPRCAGVVGTPSGKTPEADELPREETPGEKMARIEKQLAIRLSRARDERDRQQARKAYDRQMGELDQAEVQPSLVSTR